MRCSRCDFGRDEHPPSFNCGVAGEQEYEQERRDVNLPRCPRCEGLMRPGVVWFGEQLPWEELRRVENYLEDGSCDFVIVAGTTATFGYIIDWALRAKASDGELVEVNPEETPLSQFATQRVREPAAIALPRIVDQLIS
jgi:NAD-dependent deacetylase